MARFSFGGIQVRWDSYSAGFIFGEIHFRRDSVLAGFVFSGIHFGGISSGGLWNGGILSYSPPLTYYMMSLFLLQEIPEPNLCNVKIDHLF